MKDMDDVWRELMVAMFMDIAFQSVRPTDIAHGCEIDTEKINDAYSKSEYIKEYE